MFITGLEDGLFPLAKAYDDPPLLEEERRLFYVGITRAERKLYLSYAEERRRNGELMPSRQSSFLDAIPDAMVDKRSTIKVRSSGRSMMRAGGDGGYRPSRYGHGARAAATSRTIFEPCPSPSIGGLARRSSDSARRRRRRVAGRARSSRSARA